MLGHGSGGSSPTASVHGGVGLGVPLAFNLENAAYGFKQGENYVRMNLSTGEKELGPDQWKITRALGHPICSTWHNFSPATKKILKISFVVGLAILTLILISLGATDNLPIHNHHNATDTGDHGGGDDPSIPTTAITAATSAATSAASTAIATTTTAATTAATTVIAYILSVLNQMSPTFGKGKFIGDDLSAKFPFGLAVSDSDRATCDSTITTNGLTNYQGPTSTTGTGAAVAATVNGVTFTSTIQASQVTFHFDVRCTWPGGHSETVSNATSLSFNPPPGSSLAKAASQAAALVQQGISRVLRRPNSGVEITELPDERVELASHPGNGS